jgi:hypothetical protein
MELIQPRVTIQNTASQQWQVRLEHTWSDAERLDCQVLVRKQSAPIADIDRLALLALRAHIDRMLADRPGA